MPQQAPLDPQLKTTQVPEPEEESKQESLQTPAGIPRAQQRGYLTLPELAGGRRGSTFLRAGVRGRRETGSTHERRAGRGFGGWASGRPWFGLIPRGGGF